MASGKPTLILFTSTYPYGSDEAFLDPEIPYLAFGFGRVVLVPGQAEGDRRRLPPQVEVDDSLFRSGFHSKVTLAAELLRVSYWRSFRREILRRPALWTRPGAVVRLAAYLARAGKVRDWIFNRIHPGTPTVFYTYWLGAQTLGVGLAKSRFPDLRLITRAHRGDLYEEMARPPYLPLREESLRAADRVFAVSDHGRNYLCQKVPFVSKRCRVARLGVEDPGFVCRASADGVFRIVSCSYLVPVKRVGLIVESLALLAGRLRELRIEWHHLGEGPLRPALERMAREALPASVKWHLDGQRTHQEIYRFYQSQPVDLFINLSESEGVPVSIMEAQSCGIPILATGVGGTPEIVGAKGGALLRQDPSRVEVAEALELFAERPETLLEKREGSRAAWLEFSDARVNFNAFVEEILSLG